MISRNGSVSLFVIWTVYRMDAAVVCCLAGKRDRSGVGSVLIHYLSSYLYL